ncbi:MAG: carboxypeptidase regulatory-like domain-containing protein [Fibrobacter sp.]|nr:carboxypeptidase regulatory-like domain-containing protein [Fibrobacter sp.]
MLTFKKIAFITMLLSACTLYAQTTEYLIVDAPIGAQSSSKVLWVKWAGIARFGQPVAPDSGTIYYDRAPGGGDLKNYRYTVKNPALDSVTKKPLDNIHEVSGGISKRGTAFKPAEQPEMGSGVFYCVVAFPCSTVTPASPTVKISDTLISNEFVLMIESPNAADWIAPNDSITELTPTFRWKANAGVPYYHVVLSDEAISIDSSDDGKVNLCGLSIIWQAITPNTQIVYGAPDPSRTITADPPPLSPGKKYTWMVLNNYGNHPAFSSTKIKLPPANFVIKGQSMRKPKPVYPVSNVQLTSTENSKFSFKWTDLDDLANTYKIYAYIGSDFEGINAQLVVWQTEVSATKGKDTMSVEIDAATTLTSNKYVWNVIAVDNKGAGSVGDTAGFNYYAPEGTLKIHTRELIRVPKDGSIDEVESKVGLVQIKVDVLNGSLEAPLLFYTDMSGNLERKRPAGSYRITAIANEFESQTRTITINDGQTLEETFYLERPEATIYGKVVDEAGKGINLVSVYGVSDLNDTIVTKTDAAGNFILKCFGSDWRIWSEMIGYKTVVPKKVTVISAQNLSFGTITMQKNPFTLSGVVKNTNGESILGVRIRLYKSGTQVDEIPSTPQNGTFSFSIPSGTYTLTADKTGFTSYNTVIEMVNSKEISISMKPGATVVNGLIYGKTWVNSDNKYVYAPITNASVVFIKDGGGDTIKVTTDPTYGDFRTSLEGGQTYHAYSSANGYAVKTAPYTLVTQLNTTQNFNDTLNAFATINGSIKLVNGSSLGNFTITIIRNSDGTVVATGKSTANGSFEIRSIMDGNYTLIAGKDGYVLDSVAGGNLLNVVSGKPDRSVINFHMKTGDKAIAWDTKYDGAVKIKSPLIKTLSNKDTLKNAGTGTYIVNFDAASDTVIDCSYHRFIVDESESVHTDTIALPLTFHMVDSISLIDERAHFTLKYTDTLDSVKILYKDISATSFAESINSGKNDTSYTFSILPQKDGSTIVYYFMGYRGSDVYGSDQECYYSYVRPDTSRLSKFEVTPSSQDTLIYPMSYEIPFSIKGYVSSLFQEAVINDGTAVTWTLTNEQGATPVNSSGIKTTVKTGTSKTTTPVLLTVTIDTTKIKLMHGVANTQTIPFHVSGTALKAISVKRIDAQNPNPVTTSGVDKAEFAATGIDAGGNSLKISPVWSIYPKNAGTISTTGVFKPSNKFIGKVRIIAQANNVQGEYISDNGSDAGLMVRFVIANKNVPDTASNGSGCTIIFPKNIVSGTDVGIIEVNQDTLRNKIETRSGNFKVVTSNAFEIKQLENIALNTSIDSIELLINLPSGNKSKTSDKMYLGLWNDDSLQWNILSNSIVKDSVVSAKLTHFSKYTILSEASNSGYLHISPNAFSPYVNMGQIDPLKPYNGTCVSFQVQTKKQTNGKLAIYNVVGDLVWSMNIDNMSTNPYQVWWDGRTSNNSINASRLPITYGTNGETVLVPKGDKMCRNGRYFVTLTATEEINKKVYRFMKPVVLMK